MASMIMICNGNIGATAFLTEFFQSPPIVHDLSRIDKWAFPLPRMAAIGPAAPWEPQSIPWALRREDVFQGLQIGP